MISKGLPELASTVLLYYVALPDTATEEKKFKQGGQRVGITHLHQFKACVIPVVTFRTPLA